MLALRYYLWLGPNVLVAVLFGFLCYRRVYRQLPWFVAYLSSQLVLFIASLLFAYSPFTYRWVVGVFGTGIEMFFAVGAIYELTSKLLRLRRSSIYVLRICLCALGSALILAATVSAAGLFYVSPNIVTNVFQ